MPRITGEGRHKPHAILATTSSDSHTWNLLFIQLLIEESGWSVANLGSCTPVGLLRDECLRQPPDMIVISTVNGHGAQEAPGIIAVLHAEPALDEIPVYLGGKLCTSTQDERDAVPGLLAAGYTGVLVGEDAVPVFRTALALAGARPRALARPRA